METQDTTQDSPSMPSVLAIISGGGAIAWMLYQNGFNMLKHWFFYPSLFILVITCISMFPGAGLRFRRFAWTFCMWWSGLWTLVFLIAIAAPPISTGVVGWLFAPILESGRIGPFTAGFLHFFMWACAKDIVKHIKTDMQNESAHPTAGNVSI